MGGAPDQPRALATPLVLNGDRPWVAGVAAARGWRAALAVASSAAAIPIPVVPVILIASLQVWWCIGGAATRGKTGPNLAQHHDRAIRIASCPTERRQSPP